MLRLNRRMHCIVVKESDSANGMLNKVKDDITWGEISDEVLKKMIFKRGRKERNEKLTTEEAEKAFSEIKGGKKAMIKPVFRLTPPSKGFKKSIKQQYPNGEIGYRGEKINELILRMI
jgi:large subunit ribosomal protein L30